MKSALIIGASRGIGFELARQYIGAEWKVFATHRQEDDRRALRDLGAQTLRLDINDVNDLAGLGWQLDGETFDVAICNAGIYGPRDSNIGSPPAVDDFNLVMQTNVLGAMRVLPVIAPLLVDRQGCCAFISSRMGSIGSSPAGFGALYRVSKAALNMITQLANTEYGARGVRVLALHPGWVRTRMGGPNASVAVEDSVQGLRAVIADPSRYPAGGFFDYQGTRIDW